MPRKFPNLNDKVIRGKKYFQADKDFITKLRRSSLLNDRKNSNFHKFLRRNLHTRCTNERALQCINSNFNWDKKYKMAVEFDHMYLHCGDSKTASRDVMKELKEFNVLHLDLIQQQAEQLAAKDKIIKALQEENKTLRARLARIERRLSLNVPKKASEVTPISVQTDFSSDVQCVFSVKSELSPKSTGRSQLLLSPNATSPSRSPTYSESSDSLTHGKIVKKEAIRKPLLKSPHCQSTPPASPPLRISPREKRLRKDTPQDVENNLQNNNNTITSPFSTKAEPDDLLIASKDSLAASHKRISGEESIIAIKKTRNFSLSEHEKLTENKDEGLTDHNLRSRDKTKEYISKEFKQDEALISPPSLPSELPHSTSSITSEKECALRHLSLDAKKWKGKPKAEARKVRSEGILTTNKSYFLNTPRHFSELSSLDESDGTETQVEIPRWRTKVLTSLYVMEGTENLEDEIFVRRHAKLEQDERRRKRWDLQRLREQRQYERLLERYEVRNNLQDANSGYHLSLWPTPDSTHFLEIDNNLPVCAFGQPLALISPSDFTVPWVPDAAGISTRRRRR